MKLLIDMNLSPLWVKFFADSGYGSIHWSEVGEPWAPDAEIMDYAGTNGFVIFTHDLDFGALLARRRVRGPSVIQVRTQDVLPGSIGELVVRALNASISQLELGALVTVDPNRNRIRLLPIER
jgi:predicted nuclease of predicted toxin-antitoxin system